MAKLYRSTHVIVIGEDEVDGVLQRMADSKELVFGESTGDEYHGKALISDKIPWVMVIDNKEHRLDFVRRKLLSNGDGPGDFYFRVYEPSLSSK